MAKHAAKPWIRQPSWWIVVISGTLLVVFVIAIVRELINGHNVSQQVARLRAEVTQEQAQQRQLQDLIEYLGSPTFQEQEARLKLGLKKSGERVIVVPPEPSNSNTNGTDQASGSSTSNDEANASHASRWWTYFFGPQLSPRT
ncbi:MAG: septum formation initiator family protein [Candidatus Kerfeldbacteria bacterium]|nr:septum formation initiator family protein [Candidatus Kerfeldbacteria bacterium]